MKTFRQFLDEAKAAKPDAHLTISKNWERRVPGLTLHLSRPDVKKGMAHIDLNDIHVPKHLRGKGIGDRIMRGVLRYADTQNASISLRQEPERGREKDLNRFYTDRGFRPITVRDRSKRFRVTTENEPVIPSIHTHIRKPNKPR